MQKRVLMVSTVAATIGSFNMQNIYILMKLGYKVDVATDFTDVSVWTKKRLEEFNNELRELNIDSIQISFSRNPMRVDNHFNSYKEALTILKKNKYSFIHTHTPIASAVMRLAAHKTGTKVIYTAHGFHFYKGAPLRNWMIYYPIEKMLSKYTDILITINREDYELAKEKFYANRIEYIPGVGVDLDKYAPSYSSRTRIRKELKIDDSQIMLLSVGELNKNKNHEIVIRAIKNLNFVYVIVGKGALKDQLMATAKSSNVDLRLMGFRTDVEDFYCAADIYILPSLREGLNVSLMEAMANGLPCLVSRIRGNTDLIDENSGGLLFNPLSIDEIKDKVIKLSDINLKQMGSYNIKKMKLFGKQHVMNEMKKLYLSI